MSSGTRPGDAPRGRPAAVSVAAVVCLAFVALAVVAVRDLAVREGWLTGRPWVRQALDALDGTTVGTGVVVLGAALAVVGLLVLLAAVAPGRRTHLLVHAAGSGAPGSPAEAPAEVWLSPRALAFLATGIADRATGVLEARPVTATPRKVVVEVVTADRASRRAQEPREVVEGAQADVDAQTRDLTGATVVVRARKEKTR